MENLKKSATKERSQYLQVAEELNLRRQRKYTSSEFSVRKLHQKWRRCARHLKLPHSKAYSRYQMPRFGKWIFNWPGANCLPKCAQLTEMDFSDKRQRVKLNNIALIFNAFMPFQRDFLKEFSKGISKGTFQRDFPKGQRRALSQTSPLDTI